MQIDYTKLSDYKILCVNLKSFTLRLKPSSEGLTASMIAIVDALTCVMVLYWLFACIKTMLLKPIIGVPTCILQKHLSVYQPLFRSQANTTSNPNPSPPRSDIHHIIFQTIRLLHTNHLYMIKYSF